MSFFTSLSGLRNAETDLRVISQNIANAESVGFKKSNASFTDLVASGSGTDPRLTPGIGSALAGITQDFALGTFEQTGRGLDLAINGDGFFVTSNPVSGDISYTRNGSMRIIASGELQDSIGDNVQGFTVDAAGNPTSTTPSNVIVPTSNAGGASLSSVSINGRGVVEASYADGTVEPVAQIALATFPANDGLRPIGQTKWAVTGDSGNAVYGSPGASQYGSIFAGALERSNVDLAEETVALLTAQRNFQANARAIDTATQISQTVINLRS
ncbi:MAG: flagellar hook basal-body protein [Erythrobacter sp.]|uniref:flagellar hook basal-body protein n=1 Tax=Erythrobacter sp. TaxID=1042 RepID=UPI0026275E32|nr:flagellar hook basal-body protein [Erythrobacter sp.]MDJ0979156.1 flagellar hook basal-body protein [Erythrobacter sp.]